MIFRNTTVPFLAAAVLVAITACSDKQQSASSGAPADALARHIAHAERTSDIRIFSGDSLWEYIDGDAEIYHQYGFVDVATADYRAGEIELVADVYRFATEIGAYGLYSVVRPDSPTTLALGVEGFSSGGLVCVVKGVYFIRLVAFNNESSEAAVVLSQLAQAVVNTLPGTAEHPATFSLFPSANRLLASDRYFASSFAGQAFLTRVYAQSYMVNGDTLVLFLIPDSAAEKFAQWQKAVVSPSPADEGNDLPFDNAAVVMTKTFDGNLVGGLKGTRLVGMVKYDPRHKDFLAAWVSSLPAVSAP